MTQEDIRSGESTSNEEWLDANVRHAIGLLLLSGALRNRMNKRLDLTETRIRLLINSRFGRINGLKRPIDVKRLNALILAINELRRIAWRDVTELVRGELIELAETDPALIDKILKTVLPVIPALAMPAAAALRRVVTHGTFQGRTLAEWFRIVQQNDARRIRDQLIMAARDGEKASTASRRIVGSKGRGGSDGSTATTRIGLAALARTLIFGVANDARDVYFGENQKWMDRELYVAVLDGRTTMICKSLSGKVFPHGVGPHPPIHFNCRSHRVPLLLASVLAGQPTNPWTERMLLREFGELNGFDTVPAKRAAIPRGFKGKYDVYRERRVTEMIGSAPATLSYPSWLRRQSVVFQDEVLGSSRAKLFRTGAISMDEFVSDTGKTIRLDQLARYHSDAFTAAGLDPAAF